MRYMCKDGGMCVCMCYIRMERCVCIHVLYTDVLHPRTNMLLSSVFLTC